MTLITFRDGFIILSRGGGKNIAHQAQIHLLIEYQIKNNVSIYNQYLI